LCTASLALRADYDRCGVTLVFRATSGDVDAADVSGLTVAAVTDTPKMMSDGIYPFGIQYEGKAAFSSSHFARAA
jgi:hypothetical protein